MTPSARRLPRARRLTARALPSSRPQSIAPPRSARRGLFLLSKKYTPSVDPDASFPRAGRVPSRRGGGVLRRPRRHFARRPGRRARVHGGPGAPRIWRRRRRRRAGGLEAEDDPRDGGGAVFRRRVAAPGAAADATLDVRTVRGDDVSERKRDTASPPSVAARGVATNRDPRFDGDRSPNRRRIESRLGEAGVRTTARTTARTTSAPRTTRSTRPRSRVCTRTSASARSARSGGSPRARGWTRRTSFERRRSPPRRASVSRDK